MLDFNEGKACDAIVRRLEEREGVSRSEMRWPEKEQHKFPVEVSFKLGNQLFALEHTGVEPFPGHVEMENRAGHLYVPITNALKDTLGTESLFELYIPVNAFQNKNRLEIRNIQDALIDWVKITAPKMPKPSGRRGTSVGPKSVSRVPFQVSLSCFEPPTIPGHYFHYDTFLKTWKKRAPRVYKRQSTISFQSWPDGRAMTTPRPYSYWSKTIFS